MILLPPPRSLRRAAGSFPLRSGGRIALTGPGAAGLFPVARRLADGLRAHTGVGLVIGAGAAPGDSIRLAAGVRRIADREGYELTVGRSGVTLSARTAAGAFHGVSTLLQIAAQSPGGRLPRLVIRDAPAFAHRGLMIDVSRDKVPTLESLKTLIDRLASWKINQIQLYTEHTFAYRDHREVWKDASPLTGAEILELDAYCRDRFIELVPNQNSFGHLHRWLTKPRYRDLAEAPNGCDTIWGRFKEPFSLNPADPRSLALLRGLFDELLPHFSSRQFNVGCDETIDLGKDRTKALCARRGVGRVYLEFLLKIHREVKARGRTMQFWGDIILKHPELVRELPRDLVALEWGYDAGHPFAKDCGAFARAKIPFYVCPGTSSWLTILGRTANMTENILEAARHGTARGAIGLLNTDWGDQGHWQVLPISYPGYALGAAAAWHPAGATSLELAGALDRFVFDDRAGVTGRALLALGDTHLAARVSTPNATVYGRSMLTGLAEIPKIKGATPAGWQRALDAVRREAAPLRRARMSCPDADLIGRELAAAVRLAEHACRRALLAHGLPARRAIRERRALRSDLAGIMRDHRTLWLARNRPGGFRESVARMQKAQTDY